MSATLSKNNLVKQVEETRQYAFDFSNLMASDETITVVSTPTSELRGGGTSDLTITNEAISGQTVTMTISGGTKAHVYRVEVIIQTSGSQILQGDGLLRVSN